jgi:hypothetical protein
MRRRHVLKRLAIAGGISIGISGRAGATLPETEADANPTTDTAPDTSDTEATADPGTETVTLTICPQ